MLSNNSRDPEKLTRPGSGIRIQGSKKASDPADPQLCCSPVHDSTGNVMKETAGEARRVGLLREQAATHPVVIVVWTTAHDMYKKQRWRSANRKSANSGHRKY
jgi:hypothetical protein